MSDIDIIVYILTLLGLTGLVFSIPTIADILYERMRHKEYRSATRLLSEEEIIDLDELGKKIIKEYVEEKHEPISKSTYESLRNMEISYQENIKNKKLEPEIAKKQLEAASFNS